MSYSLLAEAAACGSAKTSPPIPQLPMRTSVSVAVLACLLATFSVACGGDDSSGSSSDAGDVGRIPSDTASDVPDSGADLGADVAADAPSCDVSLRPLAAATVRMERDSRADIEVLATCDDSPVAGVAVSFALSGTTAGAALRASNAQSNEDGVATATILSSGDGSFELVATAGDASARVRVRVSSTPLGDIELSIVDASGRSLPAFSAYVFDGVECASIDRFDPFGAVSIEEPIARTSEPVLFEALAPSSDYAVAAQGRDADGTVLGWACRDAVSVADAEVTELTLEVALLPVVFTGIYDVDNRFDLAAVLPPSIEATLRVLDELTDDDDLGGSIADESFGVDPAAFVLDFIYREICCWEAVDTDPEADGFQGDWSTCNAQEFTHPYGDLEQLYTRDFSTWDGAQPRSSLLCGGVAVANETLQTLLAGLIDDLVPGLALSLLDIIGDLSRAITDMHILSELTVGDVAVGKNGTFTHVLEQMVVELHDLDGGVDSYAFDLDRAGFENLSYSAETTATAGDVLVIPEHSFRLDFGRLLRFVFTDVLLPTLDCDSDHDGRTSPCTDTADLVGTWIDCGDVAAWLASEIGFLSESAYATVCSAGIEAAGAAIESALESAIDAETVITLAGTASAGEVDERREATTLVDGTWSGSLVEESVSYGEFDGTFTGVRVADLD